MGGSVVMGAGTRIENAMQRAVGRATSAKAPPKLAEALRYAVFPGGARVRPRLVLSVANACGDDCPALADAAAVAVELLHCASLVHDDMPCFDDASIRRGRPSVQAAYGAPLALLVGDALIVLAFETLALATVEAPARAGPLIAGVAQAVGMPVGITAGQGWESEADPDLALYHEAKTGALFVGSAVAGAVAAGGDPALWRTVGARLGAAYQVADDLRDALCDEEEMGKPAGQDDAHHRPNAVARLGIHETVARLEQLVGEAIASVPDCPGRGELERLILSEAKRLKPKQLAASAA